MVKNNLVMIAGVFKYKNCMFDDSKELAVVMLYTSSGTIPIVFKDANYRRFYGIMKANIHHALTCRFIGTIKNYGTTQKRKIAVECEDFTLPYYAQDFKTNDIDMSEWGEIVEDDEEATD